MTEQDINAQKQTIATLIAENLWLTTETTCDHDDFVRDIATRLLAWANEQAAKYAIAREKDDDDAIYAT